MTKNEIANRKYPYMDPLPKYSWYQVIGGIVVLMGLLSVAYVLLYCWGRKKLMKNHRNGDLWRGLSTLPVQDRGQAPCQHRERASYFNPPPSRIYIEK